MFKGVLCVSVGIWICSAIANTHGGETKWEFHTLVCSSILPFLPMLRAVQWRVKHMRAWTITKGSSEVTNPCLLPPSASPDLSSLSPDAAKKQVWTGRCLLSSSLGSFPVPTLLCPHQSRFPALLAPVQRFVVVCEGGRGSDNQLWPLLLKARLVQPCQSYSWVLFYPSFTGIGEGWITWGFLDNLNLALGLSVGHNVWAPKLGVFQAVHQVAEIAVMYHFCPSSYILCRSYI